MIRLRIAGPNFDDLVHMVEVMSHPDLRPLAEDVRGIMIQDNREGLLAGTDRDGNRMADLAESTIKRGRGGDGEPLNPRGTTSRIIDDYDVEIQDAPDRTILVGGWRNNPWVHFHAGLGAPRNNMPPRDPTGIRPDGVEKIRRAVHDFAMTLIGGRP